MIVYGDHTIQLNLSMNPKVKLLHLAFILHLKVLLMAKMPINYTLAEQAESLKGNLLQIIYQLIIHYNKISLDYTRIY